MCAYNKVNGVYCCGNDSQLCVHISDLRASKWIGNHCGVFQE